LDRQLIESRKADIARRFGAWTAHNILLGEDVYTIGHGVAGDEVKLRRVVQTVADAWRRPLAGLRVLDLACLEGLYAVEFARQGARALGIEGRQANIEKARFAKEALGLRSLELVQDDVRNLSKARYGGFDAVLCLGILYHLDAPDVFAFIERIAEVCEGFAVFDTHISLTADETRLFKGKTYAGRRYREHDPASTPEQRAGQLWASLDNPESFWLTRASLCNALAHAGFTSIHECLTPPEGEKPADRVTLLAFKGQRQRLLSSPLLSAQPVEDLRE
jgi:Methyltransferase domain